MTIQPQENSQKNHVMSFNDFLQEHFLENCQDNYFENFTEIFLYDSKKNKNGLPYPLFIQLCKSAPELVFLMMYRLNVIGDYKYVKKNLEKRNLMIGFLLGLYWFYKGENERSYRPLLRTIWPLVSFATFENCWSTELLQRCNLMYDYDIINNYVFNKFNKNRLYEKKKGKDWRKYKKEEEYLNTFRKEILYNKELVLYAQRNYLNEMFKNKDRDNDKYNNIFSLEDNSVPYDYDHICPSSYKDNRKRIHNNIIELLDNIGNFRIWPFELNRSDQDDSVANKFTFSDEKEKLFTKYNINNGNIKEFSIINKKKKLDDYIEENLKGNRTNSIINSLCNDIQNRSYIIYNDWYKLIAKIFKSTNLSDNLLKNKKDLILELNKYIRTNCKYKQKLWIINKYIENQNEYWWICKRSSYNDLIVNDFIVVCLCEENVKSDKDYEKVNSKKEFKFTLPSYSKASLEYLQEKIVQTINEYDEK